MLNAELMVEIKHMLTWCDMLKLQIPNTHQQLYIMQQFGEESEDSLGDCQLVYQFKYSDLCPLWRMSCDHMYPCNLAC